MGVYIVTGGSGGIGGKTVEILRNQGHEVLNVDLKDADICANLATKEGRDYVIDTVHEMFPDGIDGLCCNAGVSGACGNLKLIISLNYFGAVNLAHGLFDLLKKKRGSCVVTSSNTISQGAARPDIADMLNYSQMKPINEERVLKIIDKFDDKIDQFNIFLHHTFCFRHMTWIPLKMHIIYPFTNPILSPAFINQALP